VLFVSYGFDKNTTSTETARTSCTVCVFAKPDW